MIVEFHINSRIELSISINLLRSELLSLIPYVNSSVKYNSSLDSDQININLNRNFMFGSYYLDSEIVEVNISSLGVSFCSNYDYSPSSTKTFTYNGSCISMD